MTIEFEVTPEDYATFGWYHQSQPGPGAATLKRMRFGFVLVCLAVFVISQALGPEPSNYVWLLLAVLWYALFPAFIRRSARRSMQRIAEQGICRGSVGPHQLTIGAEGITDTTPYYVWTTYWAGVERVVKLSDRVIVYVGPNAAVQVPRRAFASDASFDACVAALEAGLTTVAA